MSCNASRPRSHDAQIAHQALVKSDSGLQPLPTPRDRGGRRRSTCAYQKVSPIAAVDVAADHGYASRRCLGCAAPIRSTRSSTPRVPVYEEGVAPPAGRVPGLVELDEVVLERAAQPMPTELGTLDACISPLLWQEMLRGDLIMATRDTALGLAARAHGVPVVGLHPLKALVTFSTESRRLWRAMAGDRESLGLMLVLCSGGRGRFLE